MSTRHVGTECALTRLPILGGLLAVTYVNEPALPVAFVACVVAIAGILALPLTIRPIVGYLETVETDGNAAPADRRGNGSGKSRCE